MARALPWRYAEATVKLNRRRLALPTALAITLLTTPAFAQRGRGNDRGTDRNRERPATSGEAIPRSREGRQLAAPPEGRVAQRPAAPTAQEARPNVTPG